MKNSIFEIPIISQVLNINNQRTAIAKSINLDIIRKIIEYSLKIVAVNAMFTQTNFEILLFEGRWVLSLTHTTQKIKFSIKDFYSKCDPSVSRIWSHLLEKYLQKTSFFVRCQQGTMSKGITYLMFRYFLKNPSLIIDHVSSLIRVHK